MEKMYYYFIFSIGIAFLMALAGINFGQQGVLQYIGLNITISNSTSTDLTNSFSFKTSEFYLLFTAVGVGLFALAAAIGLVASGKEASIRAAFAGGILSISSGIFINILAHIYNLVNGTSQMWIFVTTMLIFVVYLIGLILAVVEWWSNG